MTITHWRMAGRGEGHSGRASCLGPIRFIFTQFNWPPLPPAPPPPPRVGALLGNPGSLRPLRRRVFILRKRSVTTKALFVESFCGYLYFVLCSKGQTFTVFEIHKELDSWKGEGNYYSLPLKMRCNFSVESIFLRPIRSFVTNVNDRLHFGIFKQKVFCLFLEFTCDTGYHFSDYKLTEHLLTRRRVSCAWYVEIIHTVKHLMFPHFGAIFLLAKTCLCKFNSTKLYLLG